MIKVDKNVPMAKRNPNKARKYPWPSMEVGDSFFIDGVKGKGKASIYASAKEYFGEYGHASIRPEGSGIRVWRIK